jgi:Glucodextranase, domain B/Curli production assembly/transport component CsgG
VNTKRTSVLIACATCLVGLTTLLTAGCQSAGSSDYAVPRFSNWWNFYELGLSQQNSGDYKSAARQFEIALGTIPGATYGADRDIWRARTYGLHFVEGYFPNRELGVCLYHLGRYPEALENLNRSLDQTPSSRAKHYLNLVRKESLTGSVIPPPEIILDHAGAMNWSTARLFSVSGNAHSKGFIQHIQVAGREKFVELADETMPIKDDVPLKEGNNRISVEAHDLLGRKVSSFVDVTADWTPPSISVQNRRQHGADSTYELLCADDHAVAEIYVDGKRQNIKPNAGVAVSVSALAGQKISLLVTDIAGNNVSIILSGESTAGLFRHERRNVYAQAAAAGVPDAPAAVESAQPETTPASSDRMKPSLRLRTTREELVVYGDEYHLDGEVSDGGGVAAVEVNGENILTPAARGSMLSFFARRLPLDTGTNVFEVVAVDKAGNRIQKNIRIVRRIPGYMDEFYRMSLGITPLVNSGSRAETPVVQQLLREAILSDPPRFHILERDEGWDYILREQQLSLSDLTDPRTAKIIGKLLPADLMLMSSVLDHDSGVTVLAKVVDAGSGEMLFSDDVFSPGADDDLAHQLGGLILKIEQRFPLVAGRIVKLSGDTVQLDVGMKQGLQSFTRFVVIPGDGEKAAGTIRQDGDALVELAVNRIGESTGWARVIPGHAEKLIREGDYVHAR